MDQMSIKIQIIQKNIEKRKFEKFICLICKEKIVSGNSEIEDRKKKAVTL